ncbi:MAG TPA: nicotinate-nucleotide--dimethylbenzimidazole phosphoribosyltransferase [Alphaproteobacteria bacterium]|nr:nicotinate-nucleotide--dimethylbenzimidazole phosphoribosyltransferase [Alphaproteobacteria bacterium]
MIDSTVAARTAPKTLAEFRARLRALPGADIASADAARAREGQLTKPAGSLGRLEEIAIWLSAWQHRHPPSLDNPLCLVFAGNHGVVARGVSAFPGEVTRQMVANFAAGGAAINQLCKAFGATLEVLPLELDRPTADLCEAPAMNEAECGAALTLGWNAVKPGHDALLVGEMGIGNTTAAAALAAALFGGSGIDWAGPGTGLDKSGVSRKAQVVDQALAFHGRALADPLEALRRVGGRELAAISGAVAAARFHSIPVILDGFVATAAAAPLHKLEAGALDHAIAGHVSAEPGHKRLLDALDKAPLLTLNMRLGEASGAAVALGVLRAAVATHCGMATFAEAGVSGKI